MGGNPVRRITCHGALLIAVVFISFASSSVAQQIVAEASSSAVTRRVTVQLTKVPLATALRVITRQANLEPSYLDDVLPADIRVTMHVEHALVTDALALALRGTGLVAEVTVSGNVLISHGSFRELRDKGTIVGRVIDAHTQQPVRGATISIDGEARATTGADGRYYVSSVDIGDHTLAVRIIGYAKAAHHVTVRDTVPVQVNIALDPAATALDQVVVTGTVIPTELKAVPNAMTVITAKDIEQRGITRIDQLFRGDVPGLFVMNQGAGSTVEVDEVLMFSRGVTALSNSSAGTFRGTNPIKTYLDGVELADSKYLSQIDPKNIERIEILTGPQASTIYGSNAINGVMQIFTKRGTSNTPELTLTLLSGLVESSFSTARTPQHDYSAQVSGVEGRISYNTSASWNYMGPWTPAKQTARTSGLGGARFQLPTLRGTVTADVTLRRAVTQNLERGDAAQGMTRFKETGWYFVAAGNGFVRPTTYTLTGQTLGVTLGYSPTGWWSHEVGIGQDASDTETRSMMRGYTSPRDTTLSLNQGYNDRRSLRYTTTVRVPVASLAQATVTFGADAWQNVVSSLSVSPQTLTGALTGTTTVSRQPGHNTGGFLQAQLGVQDRLFLTYGLRAEWNPTFGEAAEPNYAPRYGVAYTKEFGSLTAKLRGSYGRSTRPPAPGRKIGQTIIEAGNTFAASFYGNIPYYLANPDLGPEYQQGGEGGAEVYFGDRGALVITRYNQTVDELIAQAKIDSVRSFAPDPGTWNSTDQDGYGYLYQFRNLNLGSIRNQGWELQGTVHTGPITTRGTYSWTKSRTIGVKPKYRAAFADFAQYQPGATFQYLPEHTWALGMSYGQAQTTVALNVTGVGQLKAGQNEFMLEHLDIRIRLPVNQLNTTPFAPYYVNFNKGYALADLAVSHQFSSFIEGLVQAQNLANFYTNDVHAWFPVLGRQMKAGLRIRLH